MPTLHCAHCRIAYDRPQKWINAGLRRRGPEAKFYCSYACSSAGQPRRKRQPVVKNYRTVKDKDRAIREHRLIMENHIGRPLRRDEHVHHIDENKMNNSIENLMLVTPKEHAALHPRMSYNLDEAIGLYQEGHSFNKIAKLVGAYAAADVWRALVIRGIHTKGRPRHTDV